MLAFSLIMVYFCTDDKIRNMKHTLHLFFLLFFISHVSAQEAILVIEPEIVEENYGGDISNDNLDIELLAWVKNNTEDSLILRWERIIVDQPTDWQTQVCDNNFCYDAEVSTNIDTEIGIFEPVILLPQDSFQLIFHVLPENAGRGGENSSCHFHWRKPRMKS